MKSLLASISIVTLLLFSCASVPDNPNSELAMKPGETIEVVTSQGKIRISYVDRYTRRYVWGDHDKTFRHQPRQSRWLGSLGMYRPQGDGTMHAVLEEGQQHFSTLTEAKRWLEKQEGFMDYVWTQDGLAIGWKQQVITDYDTLALHASVWQITVDGKKPRLPSSSPSSFKVTMVSQ